MHNIAYAYIYTQYSRLCYVLPVTSNLHFYLDFFFSCLFFFLNRISSETCNYPSRCLSFSYNTLIRSLLYIEELTLRTNKKKEKNIIKVKNNQPLKTNTSRHFKTLETANMFIFTIIFILLTFYIFNVRINKTHTIYMSKNKKLTCEIARWSNKREHHCIFIL